MIHKTAIIDTKSKIAEVKPKENSDLSEQQRKDQLIKQLNQISTVQIHFPENPQESKKSPRIPENPPPHNSFKSQKNPKECHRIPKNL